MFGNKTKTNQTLSKPTSKQNSENIKRKRIQRMSPFPVVSGNRSQLESTMLHHSNVGPLLQKKEKSAAGGTDCVKHRGLGWVAQLVRVSAPFAKVTGSSQSGHMKESTNKCIKNGTN